MRIIWEDGAICVIDKPAGVVVNRAESVKEETVQDWADSRFKIQDLHTSDKGGEFFEKGGVVHRLDKDTSGVMVLTKTEEAYEKLKLQFLERKTKKVYWALVHGILKEKAGVISLPIERHSKNKHKFAIGTDPARTAITEYKVINEYLMSNAQYSLVELEPRTGRTHQIRVHMKHLGHPLVADPIYGGKAYKRDLTFCPRLFLHAKHLGFLAPLDKKWVEFEADLPEDLQRALARVSGVI